MPPPQAVAQTDEQYKYERGTYRYIVLIATLIMSSIFAAKVVDVPPTNYPAAYTSAAYVLSPLTIGWVASFLFFRFRFESSIKDGRSLFLSFVAAFAVIIGPDELARNEAQLKDLRASGEQKAVPLDGVLEAVIEALVGASE